jgi:hypothetical protein
MDIISTLPVWQLATVGIAGSLLIFTSIYLVTRGYFTPIAIVAVLAFLISLTVARASSTRPPISESQEMPYTQYSIFRDMEPADQTLVNPWVGFLQEDVYANRTGPIGDFVGNNDASPKAPLYPFEGGGGVRATDIPSCKRIERDLSNIPVNMMNALEAKCKADLDKAST